MKNKLQVINFLLAWSIPSLGLVLWYVVTLEQDVTSVFPTPGDVLKAVERLLKDGTLAKNIEISTARALAGFALGGAIGFVLGIVNGQISLAEKILNTPIQMIRNVPYLAVLPLILIWFGIGETAKVVLISLGTFFPIYLNTFHGIRYTDSSLLEMGKTYGLTRYELFKDIIFPGAMSSIMVGIRQSLGLMWLTLIVAEMVAAKSGIGFMATNAREFMLMDVVVLSLIIYALLGSLSDFVAGIIEKRILRWHANYRKA
jgi:sulfonate transport system permease protein